MAYFNTAKQLGALFTTTTTTKLTWKFNDNENIFPEQKIKIDFII